MALRKRRIYKKHQLQTGPYKAKEGVIRLPRDCYWMVLRHVGSGEFSNELDADGEIALILSDDSGRGRSRSWPVISFLDKGEARHLAHRLHPGTRPREPVP